MLWTAPTLRHRRAKGWLRVKANHYEGSRPSARPTGRLEKRTSAVPIWLDLYLRTVFFPGAIRHGKRSGHRPQFGRARL